MAAAMVDGAHRARRDSKGAGVTTLVHRYTVDVDREALVADARRAIARWDWSRGAFGHALSLPRYRDLHPATRYRYENHPCTGLLDRLPHLRALFDSFECEKISWRLLRRAPASAYAWHTDQWKGPGVVRFQIPMVSDDEAFLVTTDYRNVEEIRGDRSPLSAETFDRFATMNAGHADRHRLEVGVLHYFDTTRVHTLVNAGASERVTLSFDLVANDWLRARFPETRSELESSAGQVLSRPGALGLAVAWARARAFPLRTRLRQWRRERGES